LFLSRAFGLLLAYRISVADGLFAGDPHGTSA
jgi:hypothetical protein